MLVARNTLFDRENLKDLISSEFDMKDHDEAKIILGMTIIRDQTIKVSYTLVKGGTIRCNLQCFSMGDAKSVSTLLASHFKLSKELCPKT